MCRNISPVFNRQMSESFLTATFLSMAGGLQDAYTYISRGKVFANGQTGNIVLLSLSVCEQDWSLVVRYLIPLLAFAFGVAATEMIHRAYQAAKRVHWRQLVLLIEMVLLLLVGFMPESMNHIANAVVSLSCAMQVQAFRKVNGYSFASTMCVGNLRSGTDALCEYIQQHNPQSLYKAACYLGIIVLFAIGAALGGLLFPVFGIRTIWFSSLFLLVGFLLMFIKAKPQQLTSGSEA